MKKRGDQVIYSPSDLIVYMESEFASWMDRFLLEFPGEVKPDDVDPGLLILQEKGNEHEAQYVERQRHAGVDICEIVNGTNPGAKTIEAMRAGRQLIYQGELSLRNFSGRSDFLSKVDGASDLGPFHYEVWDTKLSRKAKPYFVIQLCCYAEMLEAVQGRLPEFIGVILGDGQEKKFRTTDYIHYYHQLKERFLAKEASFSRDGRPIPTKLEDHRRWTKHAEKVLEELDHVSLVADIRKTQIRKLQKAGIETLTGVAQTPLQHIPKMEPATFAALRRQARLQLESRGLKLPKYEVLDHRTDARRGLLLLPPGSPMDVFFDMEGYPHLEGGLEYLFGASYWDGGKLEFCDWWAHDRAQEKIAFELFVDWAHARWQSDKSMHIYHYADYEVSALRRLMGRHATREEEVDTLLRNNVFVNLYTVVRQGVCVGTGSYSIKYIEHLYKEKRATEVATAMDSVVFYQKWLEQPDGSDHNSSQTLQDIRKYNRDDCDSTALLADWLREVQKKSKLEWLPPPPPNEPDGNKDSVQDRRASTQLAQELLSSLPEDPEQARLQSLLAQLLEFHRREEKPVHWAMYDRAEMTDQQLIEDANCLGGLARTKTTPQSLTAKSQGFEYKFDSSQDTKLKPGSKCFVAHDLTLKCTIESLDDEKGLITLKFTTAKLQSGRPPDELSLIPDEYVGAQSLARSIYQTVFAWHNGKPLHRPIQHLLSRSRPALTKHDDGPIIPVNADLAEASIDAVKRLDNSLICIQGPPGSGKTYTGAKIILALLKDGKRVGVASNSHRAIANLLGEVYKEASAARVTFRGAKVQSENEDFHLDAYPSCGRSKSGKDVFTEREAYSLIGGTAYAFSVPEAIGELDYLFVDEAGQVSVANMVAMGRCAKNIVVMGDQMQLSQPLKGSHPGESGQSVLDYLLQDHATIPDDFGIFLKTTYRMRPEVCRLVSEAVYEGRLHSAENTLSRRIVLPKTGVELLTKSFGILFVPVEHSGNTQGSEEEATVIGEIISELLACTFVEDGIEAKLKREQILVVAPYNMQVQALKKKHLADHVGTIDKFQGLGEPVVIVSMCASDGNESSRGIEFLFNKNRLNVALSRAKCLAIVVGSPALTRTTAARVDQMAMIDLYCRIIEEGGLPQTLSTCIGGLV